MDHAVIRLPEDDSFDVTGSRHWDTLYNTYTSHGLTPVAVEPLPNSLHNHIKAGDEKRDRSIDTLLGMFPIMDRLNIRVLCTNFMAYTGWFRSRNDIPERGGALVTGFNSRDVPPKDPLRITKERLWENLAYFLKAAELEARRFGIKIALHPDDPPVGRLGDIERILTSRENIDRALNLVPSEAIGLTLCQGCFAAMGEDIPEIISYYCKNDKVRFVHFRDIRGSREDFRETFHDNGQTNMAQAVRRYLENKFAGPVRIDHVPTMAGESNDKPGYASAGRLFALGYLKGLIDASK